MPGDDVQFSHPDVGQVVYLLGPLSRTVYDQFVRVALEAVRVCQGKILDTFPWPSAEARSCLEQLPVSSPDLFANQFLDKFMQEVKRHEEMASAFFKPPARPALTPPPRAASKMKPKTIKKAKPKKAAKGSSWHKGRPGGATLWAEPGVGEAAKRPGEEKYCRVPGLPMTLSTRHSSHLSSPRGAHLSSPRGAHPTGVPAVWGG